MSMVGTQHHLLQPEKDIAARFWTFELLIFRPVVDFHVSYQRLLEIELPITLKICKLSIMTIILEYGKLFYNFTGRWPHT